MYNYRKQNTVIEKPNNTLIYVRVSSEEQVENYSLDTQLEICSKEARRRNCQILEVFREEGRSAKTINGRPVLMELLSYCKKNRKHICSIIVYRLDRLSRQISDYISIRKTLADCGISLISATEPTGNSPTEKLIETILAGFAQHDNDIRSERTKNGLRARFLAGLFSGPAPLGYINLNGVAVTDPTTFEILKKGWELMATGTKSLQEMANILNEQGIRKPKLGVPHPLRKQTVGGIFRNKFYAGYLTSSRYPEEIKAQHTPMVTEETFYKVQSILDGRCTHTQALSHWNRDNPDFPLRRLIMCSKCGTPFTGAWSKGHRSKHAYYFCRKRCGTPSVPTADIHVALVEVLRTITPTQEALELFFALLRQTYKKRFMILNQRKNEADTEIKKLLDLRQTLVEKNLAGVYSDEIFKEQNKIIDEKMESAQITKSDSIINKYNLNNIIEFMRDKFSDLGMTFVKSDLKQQRVLLHSIFALDLVWSYPGLSNAELNPLYQIITDIEEASVKFGAWKRNRTSIPYGTRS